MLLMKLNTLSFLETKSPNKNTAIKIKPNKAYILLKIFDKVKIKLSNFDLNT
jgi:hypothetical protein